MQKVQYTKNKKISLLKALFILYNVKIIDLDFYVRL